MTLVETSNPPALPTLFDPYEEISRRARPSWNKALIAGYAVILVFFGGFGGFAAFAPLPSAVRSNAASAAMSSNSGVRIYVSPMPGAVSRP